MGRKTLGHVKKKPADYPQFAFRVSDPGALKRIRRLLNEVQKERNMDGTRPHTFKNDLILEALELGLISLKRGRRGQ